MGLLEELAPEYLGEESGIARSSYLREGPEFVDDDGYSESGELEYRP